MIFYNENNKTKPKHWPNKTKTKHSKPGTHKHGRKRFRTGCNANDENGTWSPWPTTPPSNNEEKEVPLEGREEEEF